MTIKDINKISFRNAVSDGYNKDDVDLFVESVREDYASYETRIKVLKENLIDAVNDALEVLAMQGIGETERRIKVPPRFSPPTDDDL